VAASYLSFSFFTTSLELRGLIYNGLAGPFILVAIHE
jgi:hypothetical protein